MAIKSTPNIHPRALHRLQNALREALRDIDLPPGKYIEVYHAVIDTDARHLTVRWEFTDHAPKENV